MEIAKTTLDLFHLLGLVLSFGLVLLCDYLLISLITKGSIDSFQFKVLKRCSQIITPALQVLILIGLGYLFYYIFNDQIHLLSNPKLIAKELVVIILCINGYWLHSVGLQILEQNINQSLHRLETLGFFRKVIMMGGISSVSWWTAFVLGIAKMLNFKFGIEFFLGIYFVTIAASLIGCESYIVYLKRQAFARSKSDHIQPNDTSGLDFIETNDSNLGMIS